MSGVVDHCLPAAFRVDGLTAACRGVLNRFEKACLHDDFGVCICHTYSFSTTTDVDSLGRAASDWGVTTTVWLPEHCPEAWLVNCQMYRSCSASSGSKFVPLFVSRPFAHLPVCILKSCSLLPNDPEVEVFICRSLWNAIRLNFAARLRTCTELLSYFNQFMRSHCSSSMSNFDLFILSETEVTTSAATS